MKYIALLFIALFPTLFAQISACTKQTDGIGGTQWRVDHYAYDASLRRDWEVVVDCSHPASPGRMRFAENVGAPVGAGRKDDAIKAGTSIILSSPRDASAVILLRGTAMETAFVGQRIRVRLNLDNRFVEAIVRGSHSAELVPVQENP